MKRIALFVMLAVMLVLSACGGAPAAEKPAEVPAATEAAAAATEAPAATEAAAAGEPESCAAELGCAMIAKGETVKVGYSGPMTGDYSQFGIDMSNAMKLAVADFGDVQGWKVEMAIEDDGGGAEGGAAVANKLVSDPTFVAMAGHAFSGATAAAMPIYEKAGVPMMSPSATNPDLTSKGSAVFNRNAFTDTEQGIGAAKYLFEKLGIKKLALMHDGGDYGQGLAKVVEENFKALGGEIVAFEAVTPGESDYSAPLAAVAAAKPEALYFGGYNAEAAVLVNQMAQAGLSGVVFFGGDGIYGKDFLAKVGDNGEGVYSATLVPPGTDPIVKFNEAYLGAYGTEAGVLSAYTWNSYDAVAALITAINSVAIVEGDTLYIPRAALVEAVRTMKDYQGIAGVITCRENGECNASGPVFYIVKDGNWVPAE
jgi:branched-chain amino acid transport system substrate-binding protein